MMQKRQLSLCLACDPRVDSWEKYLARQGLFNHDEAVLERAVIAAAADIGAAARLFAELQTGLRLVPENLGAILDFWHIRLIESACPYAILFGEYVRFGRKIILYSAVIEKYAALFSSCGSDLKSVCMAHELFHFIETQRFGETKKLLAPRVKASVKKYSRAFRQVSEIAAHTFAQIVFDLQEIPLLYVEQHGTSDREEAAAAHHGEEGR